MSYGQNLVQGVPGHPYFRVGPYRFCSGGTLDKPSSWYRFGYRFRVGPYRFLHPATLSILLWSYLILSDPPIFFLDIKRLIPHGPHHLLLIREHVDLNHLFANQAYNLNSSAKKETKNLSQPKQCTITHRIHGTGGISTYLSHRNQQNVNTHMPVPWILWDRIALLDPPPIWVL